MLGHVTESLTALLCTTVAVTLSKLGRMQLQEILVAVMVGSMPDCICFICFWGDCRLPVSSWLQKCDVHLPRCGRPAAKKTAPAGQPMLLAPLA